MSIRNFLKLLGDFDVQLELRSPIGGRWKGSPDEFMVWSVRT